MAQSDRYDALIALGAVIRGETYHFEVVSNDSCRAVMDVQLDTGIPVANGILTCENDEQALARTREKGSDCARTVIEVANLLRAMDRDPYEPSNAQHAGQAGQQVAAPSCARVRLQDATTSGA